MASIYPLNNIRCVLISFDEFQWQLAIEQPSTGGCWKLLKKDIPHSRPQRDGKRGKITLKLNPIPEEWATP